MKKSKFTIGLTCVILIYSVLFVFDVIGKDKSQPKLRIGTFDSRAVVIAYASSEWMEQKLQSQKKELARAEEKGDTVKVEELKKLAVKTQERMHAQGFGTASVDDLLKHIAGEFPRISKEAGVDIIMSKWDVVYKTENVELVDITDRIVEPYKPNERTLGWIKDLKKVKPLTQDQLDDMDHSH